MKVVINKCWGGFGISSLAVKELVMMRSDVINSFTPKHCYGGEKEKYTKTDWQKEWESDYPSDFVDIGDGFMGHKYNYYIYKDGLLYNLKDDYEDRHKIRSHPDLIKVIEKLGADANGSHASLSIIEIPDDVEYEIDEYDGIEHIAEKHRTWG